jgi:hypothetical protein
MGAFLGRESVDADVERSAKQAVPNGPEGWHFHDHKSTIWTQYPNSTARLNPPADTLPLAFKYYGQAFFKGYDFEKKV